MTTPELIAASGIALVLDAALGDPAWLPHPVRAIGRAARALEPLVVARLGRTRLAGALFAAAIIGGAGALAWLAVALAAVVSPLLEFAVATGLLYTAFAAGDLDQEARGITRALRRGDLPGARRALARIVGRDTHDLDVREVVRGGVESIAESTLDGCIAPLFWALVGGPAAALAFKAASTLDSLVGHRDELYRDFGTAAARADDVLCWLPARAARLLFPAAAALTGLRAAEAWRIGWRDGHKSPSPNAGIPEAAAAGALGVQLGGLNFYAGEPHPRPLLGDPLRELETDDLPRSIRLMYAVTALAWVAFASLRLLSHLQG